jgi:hypothetical protein
MAFFEEPLPTLRPRGSPPVGRREPVAFEALPNDGSARSAGAAPCSLYEILATSCAVISAQ